MGFSSCGSQALELRLSSCGALLVVLWHVGFSHIRDWTHVSCNGRQILYHQAAKEVLPSRLLDFRIAALSSWQFVNHCLGFLSWLWFQRQLPPLHVFSDEFLFPIFVCLSVSPIMRAVVCPCLLPCLMGSSSSVTQLCLTLCDPMNCSTPDCPVHHQLLEPTQTHVHWVGDAIQPSQLPSSPSPPALNLSQHQGLFKWVSSSHQVAKVLEFQLQHQSFQWTPRTDLL